MKQEEIVCLVIAFFLGYFLSNIMNRNMMNRNLVEGMACKVKAGYDDSPDSFQYKLCNDETVCETKGAECKLKKPLEELDRWQLAEALASPGSDLCSPGCVAAGPIDWGPVGELH